MSTKRFGEFYLKHTLHTLLYVMTLLGTTHKRTVIETTLDHLKHLGNGDDLLPKVQEALRYARRMKYVSTIEGKLVITSSGNKRLLKLSFERLKQTEPWDGKWRIVMFDIPAAQNKARDQIRRLIKQLGFEKLQQSVWVHPLPCMLEFGLIREAYGITEHVRFIQCESEELNRQYLKMFIRKYPTLV